MFDIQSEITNPMKEENMTQNEMNSVKINDRISRQR